MNSTKRVMLLIDADNVSAAVIEQAIEKVRAEHGAIHVRRAYCTAESAVTHQKLFKACSIRPIVNLSSGKNANDIALAVDAMDLAVSERPEVAVIVSSDSDFAPLVIRLREKGCRVEGIGQLGKTGEDSKAVYDSFVDLAHQKPGRASPLQQRSGRSARTPRAPVPPVAVAVTSAPPVAAPAAPSPAPRRRRASPSRAPEMAATPVASPTVAAPAPASEPAEKTSRRRRSRR